MTKAERRVVRAAMDLHKMNPFTVRFFEMRLVRGVLKATGKTWYREGYVNELMQSCAALQRARKK